MRDIELYRQILGVMPPWKVESVRVDLESGEVLVGVAHDGSTLRCPTCELPCARYDARERRWRHLDTCQLRTVLVAMVPRAECKEHGVHQVGVPWAEAGSQFTAMFEALAIDWLLAAPISKVAARMGMTWEESAGIQDRAVARGLARRKLETPSAIGVDETSRARGQTYVTIVSDLDRPRVLSVSDGHKSEALDEFYETLGPEACKQIACVAMDMWPAYIESTRRHLPDADGKIVFDRFHVAKHLGDAVDETRRSENRQLLARGDRRLVGSRYLFLRNPENLTAPQREELRPLRKSRLKVARALAIRLEARTLWAYSSRGWAERQWKAWMSWAMRSRIEPIKKVARMVKKHWEGIINAATTGITNAMAEGINEKIQWLRRQARGLGRERFKRAIFFHLGGLDLYPSSIAHTHTKA